MPNNDYPTELIQLPSKGYFYPEDSPLSKGEIHLRYPTARDEDILLSQKLIKNNTVINEFVKNLIDDVKVNIYDLLIGDMNILIIASRILTYGPKYNCNIPCPSCSHINKDISINLNDLNSNEEENIIDFELYDKFKNEFKYILPKSQKEVIFKLLTVGDNLKIDEMIKNKSKYYRNSGVDPFITSRLKQSIISIDGKTGNEKDIDVDNLLSLDSLSLRTYMADVTPNIDTDIHFICTECGHEEDISLPMGKEFFWPSRRV